MQNIKIRSKTQQLIYLSIRFFIVGTIRLIMDAWDWIGE